MTYTNLRANKMINLTVKPQAEEPSWPLTPAVHSNIQLRLRRCDW